MATIPMDGSTLSRDVLDMILRVRKESRDLQKTVTLSTGLQGYDLSKIVFTQVPVLTPLRNLIPRHAAPIGSLAAHWKSITAATRGVRSPFVAEKVRNGKTSFTVTPYTATHKTLGLDSETTWEAQMASRNFDDALAEDLYWLMQLVFLSEEDAFLFGNGDENAISLGTTPTPTVTSASSGGSIGAGTYNVVCVALPGMGYDMATRTAPLALAYQDDASAAILGTFANKSNASSTGALSGSTNVISAYLTTPVTGAFGYAWYVGTSGNEKLEAITTIAEVQLTALAGTGQALTAITWSDNSQDANAFDGVLTQTIKNGHVTKLATNTTTPGSGTTLTSDGAGGIVEIDDTLQYQWDTNRLGPDVCYINSQEARSINKLVVAGGGSQLWHFVLDRDGKEQIEGGSATAAYFNKFTGRPMKMEIHPKMPPGSMHFWTQTLPPWFPRTVAPQAWDFYTLADYAEVEYPFGTGGYRSYQHGVYEMGVLRGFFNAAQSLITNIAPTT